MEMHRASTTNWFRPIGPDDGIPMMVEEAEDSIRVNTPCGRNEDGIITDVKRYTLFDFLGQVVAADVAQVLVMEPSCGHSECVSLSLEFPLN